MRIERSELYTMNGTALPEWTLIPLNEEVKSGLRDSGYSIWTPKGEETHSRTCISTSSTKSWFTNLSLLGVVLLKISLSVFTLLYYITFLGFLLSASVAFAILGLITSPIWAPPVLFWRHWLLKNGALTNGT